jgi:hypothetical protein
LKIVIKVFIIFKRGVKYMKIEESAKSIIYKAFQKQNGDSLYIQYSEGSCSCSAGVQIEVVKAKPNEDVILIDGVPVLMDEETEMSATGVILRGDKDELLIIDEMAKGCGCSTESAHSHSDDSSCACGKNESCGCGNH